MLELELDVNSKDYDGFLADYHRTNDYVAVNANELQEFFRRHEALKRELQTTRERLDIMTNLYRNKSDSGIKYILDLKV